AVPLGGENPLKTSIAASTTTAAPSTIVSQRCADCIALLLLGLVLRHFVFGRRRRRSELFERTRRGRRRIAVELELHGEPVLARDERLERVRVGLSRGRLGVAADGRGLDLGDLLLDLGELF